MHIGYNDYEIDTLSTGPFTPPFTRWLAPIAHSFACSALLASLARSAALIRSLARSLTHSGAHGKAIYVYKLNASISHHLSPLCSGPSLRRNLIVKLRRNGKKHVSDS